MVKQNQSKREITFDTQLKSALCTTKYILKPSNQWAFFPVEFSVSKYCSPEELRDCILPTAGKSSQDIF